MTDADVRWVATMNDGNTAVEHLGEYQIIPGERKPWVRLCTFLADNDLYLTSLRLNFRGRTIHMPRLKFDRFDMNEKNCPPLFYSLQYHLEGEFDEDVFKQANFIDLSAHYKEFTVHYIQDITDGANSWILITYPDSPMAATPLRGESL